MNNTFSWDAFNKIPVVGILRNVPIEKIKVLAAHYQEAGFSTLEITMNSEGASETIAHLAATFRDTLNIGAGTVCTLDDLDKALAAGASFIVTPILNEEVIKACVTKKIPIFPGAYTPTEIYRAWSLGAEMVKVFPATRLGSSYIKDVLAPLPHLKLLPTGGISIDNFTEFLQAGAKGLGVGSTLFPSALLEKESWDELKDHFVSFRKKYDDYSVAIKNKI